MSRSFRRLSLMVLFVAAMGASAAFAQSRKECTSFSAGSSAQWIKERTDVTIFEIGERSTPFKGRCNFVIFLRETDYSQETLRSIGSFIWEEYGRSAVNVEFYSSRDEMIARVAARKRGLWGLEELSKEDFVRLPKEDAPNTVWRRSVYLKTARTERLDYEYVDPDGKKQSKVLRY